MGASAAKEGTDEKEERDEDLLLDCEEEAEREEEEDKHLLKPPPAGRVLLRGAFAGTVVTSDHHLDTSVCLDYEVAMDSIHPVLDAFIRAAKDKEVQAEEERAEKEAKKLKAAEEDVEGGEEAEEENKEDEQSQFVSSESWKQLLTIMAGDSVDLDQVLAADASTEVKNAVRAYKAKLEELKLEYNMLQSTHEAVKKERDQLLEENEILRLDAAKKSLEPSHSFHRQLSMHSNASRHQISPEVHQEMEDLRAHIAKLQGELEMQRKSNVVGGDPNEWKGSLTVHGAFVGKIKTACASVDVSIPVRGDLPLSLVLPTVQHLKWSSILQQEKDELTKAEREREKLEKEAEGEKEDEKEEEEKKEEEKAETNFEESKTSPEVWDQIFSFLSDGVDESDRYVLDACPQQNAPSESSSVPASLEAGKQATPQSRKAEMQELSRMTEANYKTLESVVATELEIKNLKKEFEKKLFGDKQRFSDNSSRSRDLPTLMTSTTPSVAVPSSMSPVKESSAPGAMAFRVFETDQSQATKKRVYDLSWHVQDLEKWAEELNSFSAKHS